MNSAWPLVSAALLMGAGGSLHCLTMCAGLQRMTLRGIPVITVKGDAATPRTSEDAPHPSASASAPNALKATAASTITPDNASTASLTGPSLARHLALKLPDARWWRFQAGPGRRTEWLRGMLWALLPCGLLYTALGTAILAATPLGAAAVMAAFALGTNLGLFLVEAGARNLLGNRAPQVAYRLNGILLIMLSAAGLAAALAGHAHPYC